MNDVLALIFKRIVSAIVVLLLIVTLIFFLMRFAGDPTLGLMGESATAEGIAAFRARHGLDLPLGQQYVNYLQGATRGDFGTSFRYPGESAMGLVLERMPATLRLGSVAIVLAIVVAVPVGIYSALRPGSYVDTISRIASVMGQSIPIFWLGILLILVFAVTLQVLPAIGAGSWQHLVLPGVTLSIYSVPLTMRLVRSSMLEVLNQEYIKTARSKGISETRVNLNHALRNASIPVITVIGLRVGSVMSGTVVLEEVFAYPGMGRLAIESMRLLDYAVIQAFVIVVAALIIAINLIVDILYGLVDPRIRVK